ncbi:hypothetical protein BC826DRAFT_1066846, partial [Russula brevipes]
TEPRCAARSVMLEFRACVRAAKSSTRAYFTDAFLGGSESREVRTTAHQVGIFMRRGTLNVDTRSNTFRLRKDAHALFDKGGIILLPEGDVV